MIRLLTIVLIVFIPYVGMSQIIKSNTAPPPPDGFENPGPDLRLKYPIFSFGSGAMMYLGSLKSPARYQRFFGLRPSFHAGLEQRFGKVVGISGNFLYGWVASEKRDVQTFYNFQSRVINADVRLTLNFDYLLFKKRQICPFVSLGAGYLNFATRSDLKDTDGKTYFLWDDGVLRDQSQTGTLTGTPKELRRDYTYETDVTPNGHNTLVIPVSAGFRFKMHDFWDFQLAYTYYYTISRFVKSDIGGWNDGYGYLSFGFSYYFGQLYQGRYELDKLREEFKDAK